MSFNIKKNYKKKIKNNPIKFKQIKTLLVVKKCFVLTF